MDSQGGKQINPKTADAVKPKPEPRVTGNESQLIDKKGEKYLRDAGKIEDYPDTEDEEQAEKDQAS